MVSLPASMSNAQSGAAHEYALGTEPTLKPDKLRRVPDMYQNADLITLLSLDR